MILAWSGRTVLLAAFLVSTYACLGVDDSSLVVPPEPAATVEPRTQWAGGVVRVNRADIVPQSPPQVSVGDRHLASVAAGQGWAEYRLPGDVRGAVTLEIGGREPETLVVEVLGFRWVRPLGMDLYGNLLVWPRPERTDQASLLAIEEYGRGVIRIIGTSARHVLEDLQISGADVRSVVPSYDPEVVLVRNGVMEMWRLRPAPHVVDTLQGASVIRHAMLLSDSVYVASAHHDISAWDPRAGSQYSGFRYFGLHEETQGMVISPSGRYGAVRLNGSQLGPPVFSADQADSVVHIDTLSHSDGVDFSPVGDTLYIAGLRRNAPRDHLVLAVDPSTGVTFDGLELPDYEPLNLVRDPYGPWLYVMAAFPPGPPRLLVIDTRTMELAGEIETSGYLGCDLGCEGAVAIGREGIIFVTTGHLQTRPSVVFGFDPWPGEIELGSR